MLNFLKKTFPASEFRKKDIIGFSSNKETVKFIEIKEFFYDEERSGGKLSDQLNVINIPVYVSYLVIKLVDD